MHRWPGSRGVREQLMAGGVESRFPTGCMGCLTMKTLIFAIASLTFAATTAFAAEDCFVDPGPGVDWSGCSKEKLMLTGGDMQGANLTGTILNGSGFAEANLAGAKLDGAEISRVSFKSANLSNASMEKASGSKVEFAGANLSGARLAKLDVSRSNFTGANLAGADLTKAELTRCDFAGADLSGAKLKLANLERTSLTGATLTGADFTDTYLYRTLLAGADLSQASGLQQKQLDSACGDAKTKLPDGLVAPSQWPCEE